VNLQRTDRTNGHLAEVLNVVAGESARFFRWLRPKNKAPATNIAAAAVEPRHVNLQRIDRAKDFLAEMACVVAGKMAVLQMVEDVVFPAAHLAADGAVELRLAWRRRRVHFDDMRLQIEAMAYNAINK
jgi:hypothetical protein